VDAATAAQGLVAIGGLEDLTLVVGDRRGPGAKTGVDRGSAMASAAMLARELANTPPAHLTARMIADKAVEIAAATGLGVEVFNKDQLAAMGCGGMVGVNKGSTEPPRVVRLSYAPRNP